MPRWVRKVPILACLSNHANQDGITGRLQYINNIVEQDHRAIKRVTKPMLNFKSFESVKCVISDIVLMPIIRKGQLILEGCNEMSYDDQFYALAG